MNTTLKIGFKDIDAPPYLADMSRQSILEWQFSELSKQVAEIHEMLTANQVPIPNVGELG